MAFKKVRLLGPDISLQGLDIVAFQNQRDAIAKNLHEVGDWAARPFREVAGALVADYSTRSYKTIERSLLTGESPEAQFVHDLLGDLRVDAQPFADQLKIYARDPSQLAIDLSPVIRDGTGKLQWNKRGARNFGLLTVLVATAGYGAACAASVLKNGGGGGGGVTPTINKDNCPSLTSGLTSAAVHLDQASSFIGVEQGSMGGDKTQLLADIQCFVKDAQSPAVFKNGDNSIVSFVAPDENKQGSLRPVWAVVDGAIPGDIQGGMLLQLISASDRDISVTRNNGQLAINMNSASVAGDKEVANGGVPIAQLQIDENDSSGVSGSLIIGEKEIVMTADQLGQQAGAVLLVSAVQAFQEQETELKNSSVRTGISPDLTFASGVAPSIEGGTGQSLEVTANLQSEINNQGFIPILVDQTHLNLHQDGKIGLGVTSIVADRNNPAITYDLVQQENGEWVVVAPGVSPQTDANGLVNFGSQGNSVEKMIASVPNIFGNLEAVNIIVKDQTKIPDNLKNMGFEFLPGTVFTALIDPATGEIISLVPAIHSGEVTVKQDAQGKLEIDVKDGGIEQYILLAKANPTLNPTATLTETVTATATATATATEVPTEISQDLTHPENLPKTTLEVISSTKFAQDFLDAAKAGKLPKAPSTAKPAPIVLEYNDYSGLAMIRDYGECAMFNLDAQKVPSTDNLADLSERPNYVAAAFQVVAPNGEIAYLVVMGYVNGNSQPDGYWGYLYKPHDPSNAAQELTSVFPGSDQTRSTTANYLANEKGSESYFKYWGGNPNSAFGSWYLTTAKSNPNLILPDLMLKNWQNKKILDNMIYGKPLIPISPTTNQSLG